MKYIAVFEVPDNEDVSEGAILMCGLNTYGANVKKAPNPRCNIHGITQEDFWERAGYDRALKDCGVI